MDSLEEVEVISTDNFSEFSVVRFSKPLKEGTDLNG